MRAPADSLSELADRLVETGIPWNSAGADVGHALGDRLLVDVDPVAVPGGERARVAGRLREADQQQRDRRGERSSPRGRRRRRSPAARARAGRAARRPPAPPVGAEVEDHGRQQPTDHQHERARHLRRDDPQPEDTASETTPTSSVVACTSSSEPSHDHSSCQALSPAASVPVSLGSSPIDDVDRAPEEEPGDHGPGQELRDPPHPEDRQQQEQHAGGEGDRGDELRGLGRRRCPVASTAPPATAASAELGPVEICRDVPKIA